MLVPTRGVMWAAVLDQEATAAEIMCTRCADVESVCIGGGGYLHADMLAMTTAAFIRHKLLGRAFKPRNPIMEMRGRGGGQFASWCLVAADW
jgi:hypothetical protein